MTTLTVDSDLHCTLSPAFRPPPLSLSLPLYITFSLFLSLRVSLPSLPYLSFLCLCIIHQDKYLRKITNIQQFFLFLMVCFIQMNAIINYFSEMCLFPDYFRRRCSFLATHRLTRLHLLGRCSLVIWLWMVLRLGRWSGLSAMHWAPSLDSSRTAGERWPAERKKKKIEKKSVKYILPLFLNFIYCIIINIISI